MQRKHHEFLLLALLIITFIWSGWTPLDRFTWYLEVFPAAIGALVIIWLRRSFPLSLLLLWLILVHCIILLIGGHYTYAQVPLFNWLMDFFHFTRNHYDRVGHFAQGFVPALIAREVILRTTPLRPGKMLFFLVVSVALAISGAYEIFEALVSIITSHFTGEGAVAFLGMQGDPWDTQEDMTCALVGAVTAQLTLAKRLQESIAKIGS